MKLPILAVAALAALVLAGAPTARAATWRQITASGGATIDQVGIARTADGVLHVAWRHRTGPNTEDLTHTAIGADGKIRAASPIATGWASLSNAALTAVPGGLRVVWGGIRTIDSGERNQDLNTALSTDGGATWTLQIGSIVPLGGQAYGSSASATTLPSGTTLQAWAGTLGTWVHRGLDPATPNFNFQLPLGNYGYDPGLAADAGGAVTMAWYSNATGHLGVYAQGVAADGAPIGVPVNMPGTADMNVGMLSRTPIVARPNSGGFYVAYPTGYPPQDQVRLWKVGTTATRLLDRTSANALATVSTDAKGRLWVVWTDGTFGSKRVLAARSNRSATEFGAAVNAGAAKSASSVYQLDASATTRSVDLLALFGIGAKPGGSTYHARILPGLTLKAKPSKLARKPSRVTFTVTDAGDPVRGAKVRASGKSDTTDGEGRATLTLTRTATATASTSGYKNATVRLK